MLQEIHPLIVNRELFAAANQAGNANFWPTSKVLGLAIGTENRTLQTQCREQIHPAWARIARGRYFLWPFMTPYATAAVGEDVIGRQSSVCSDPPPWAVGGPLSGIGRKIYQVPVEGGLESLEIAAFSEGTFSTLLPVFSLPMPACCAWPVLRHRWSNECFFPAGAQGVWEM